MAAVLVASNFRPFSFVHTSQSTYPANTRRPNSPFYHHYPTPTSTAVTSKFNLYRAKSDGFWERVESVLKERGEEDEEVEEEEGVEVIFVILQSFFRKVSRKAKKASRSVLPPMIPSKLVSSQVTVGFSFIRDFNMSWVMSRIEEKKLDLKRGREGTLMLTWHRMLRV